MSDDVIPMWKRALEKARTPDRQAVALATRQAKKSVQEALMNAFDKLGNEAFFIRLGNGSAEDKRCLAVILAKLLPLQVEGSMDHALTVTVVTQLGERETVIDVGPARNLKHHTPRDAATGERLEVVEPLDA